ncbi:hypothetical protein KFE25_000705 [Diacronema lutheri]|uniref:Ankyrin repeat protein n=1 Tax=Diacronema lutheri TaxID=2081491 RepID=A0A8J5XVN8_DIALT|nr:hypothetical protein KFE25_000705 [Diacronema lutheri]
MDVREDDWRAASTAGDARRLRELAALDGHDDLGIPLVLAAKAGHVDAVRVILGTNMPDADMRRTALRLATRSGHAGVVELLLDSGAELSDDALIEAAACGSEDLLQLLIARGAERGRDEALVVAAERGATAAVRTLLAAGAGSLNPALKGAIDARHAPTVVALVDAGASAAEGLCHAALVGAPALVDLLIDRGASNLDQAFFIGAKAGQTAAVTRIVLCRAAEAEGTQPASACKPRPAPSGASSAIAAHLAMGPAMLGARRPVGLAVADARAVSKPAFFSTVRAPQAK